MMARHDAKAVANYFLDLAGGTGHKLTPLKIQKLVYYAHGWHLALKKEPLLDERVEAWKFGPVIPSLYHEFKIYGSNPIEHKAVEVSLVDGDVYQHEHSINDSCSLEEVGFTEKLLKRIWEVYKNHSGLQLSELTHQPGTPWDRARTAYGDVKNADIPDEWIREYFESQIARRKN